MDEEYFEFPLEEFIESLPNGENRFHVSNLSFTNSDFPYSETEMEDYWESENRNEIVFEEYSEEIKYIRNFIFKNDENISENNVNKTKKIVLNRASLIKYAKAYNIWDKYAIPNRLYENKVYRIWTPIDLVSEPPKIKSLPLDEFIRLVAEKAAENKRLMDKQF